MSQLCYPVRTLFREEIFYVVTYPGPCNPALGRGFERPGGSSQSAYGGIPMKKLCLVTSLLLLSSVAFAGENPESADPSQEDAVLSTQTEAAPSPDIEFEPFGADPVFLAGSCSATADCWDGSTVTCTTTSGSCDFADSSCPSEHGWATCGSNESHCPACPCPPPAPKCIENRSCTNPCGSECGPAGTCIRGSCNCLI